MKRALRAETTPFDAAEYLDDPRTVVAYLNEVLDEGDPAAAVAALGTIARSRGMAKLARSTGLGRESLYKSLSRDGNPSFKTVVGIAAALGYRFSITSASAATSVACRPRRTTRMP